MGRGSRKGTAFVQAEEQRSSLEFGCQNVHLSIPSLLELPVELPGVEKEQTSFLFSWKTHSQQVEVEAGKLQVGFGGVWGGHCPSLVPSDPSPSHQNWPDCQENNDKSEHGRLERCFPQLNNILKKREKKKKAQQREK